MKKYRIKGRSKIQQWERVYFTEGAPALYVDHRGRKSTGRPAKLPKQLEEDLLAENQRLRMEVDYLKKIECLGFQRGTAKQKAQVVWEPRRKYSLIALLQLAQISRSTYYYYTKQQTKSDKYSEVKEQITAIYHENKGRYGYRCITDELHIRGFIINRKTVQCLMKQLGLSCMVRMKKHHSYKGEVGKIAPNLLKRNFEADKPDQKWVADVTEMLDKAFVKIPQCHAMTARPVTKLGPQFTIEAR